MSMRDFDKSICGNCRYWSEMIARAGGGTTNPRGDTEALCLCAGSQYSGSYTTAEMTCVLFAVGYAIDEPGVDDSGCFHSEI